MGVLKVLSPTKETTEWKNHSCIPSYAMRAFALSRFCRSGFGNEAFLLRPTCVHLESSSRPTIETLMFLVSTTNTP